MKKTLVILAFALIIFGVKNFIERNSDLLTASVAQPEISTSTDNQPKTPTSTNQTINLTSTLPVEIKVTHLETPKMLRGLYVTYYSFESKSKFSEVVATAKRNGINSLIIDVNSDGGPLFDFKDDTIKQTLANLHSNNIYLIARVVAFKISDKQWYEPASKSRWDQLADISKRAIDLGFDEINFDYVRYGGPSEATSTVPIEQRRPNIRAFFEFLNKEVRQKLGRPISADVFGITFIDPQAEIGQNMEDAANNFDYVMPMPYPSHWALGSFNIKHPGNDPYQTVYQALTTGWGKIKNSSTRIAQLRSWIQAFGIESISPWKLRTYTGQDVQDQINACTDTGCVGWALWNGFSNYPDSYFSAPKTTSSTTITGQ
jgi:hypothetical protein